MPHVTSHSYGICACFALSALLTTACSDGTKSDGPGAAGSGGASHGGSGTNAAGADGGASGKTNHGGTGGRSQGNAGSSAGGAATGGDSSAGSGPVASDGFVSAYVPAADMTSRLTAGFWSEPEALDPECTETEMGDCLLTDCTGPGHFEDPTEPRPHAGQINFSALDGAIQMTTQPDENGNYYAATNTSTLRLVGQEMVELSAAGGDIPAFRHIMAFPLLLLSKTPTAELGIDLANDFGFGWTRGATDVFFQLVIVTNDDRLVCSVDSMKGTLNVPKALLAPLKEREALEEPLAAAYTVKREFVTVGKFRVTAQAVGNVYNSDHTSNVKFTVFSSD